MSHRLVEVVAHLFHRRVAFASLLFRALPPEKSVALPLLGDSDLAAQLLRARRLFGHKARELVSSRFSRSPRAVRRIARCFGGSKRFLGSGHVNTEVPNANLEAR